MALTDAQKAELAYKSLFGVATTSTSKIVAEEAYLGNVRTYASKIWSQDHLIPDTAPGATSGVLQLIEDLELTPVPGVSGAYYHEYLEDAVHPGWDSEGGSYVWSYKDGGDNDALVEVGQKNIAFIPGFPIIVLFGGDLSTPNLKVTFYRYTGQKGIDLSSVNDLSPVNLNNNSANYITIGTANEDSLIQFRFKLTRNSNIATGFVEILNTSVDDSSESSFLDEELFILEPYGRIVYSGNDEVGEGAIDFTVDFNGFDIRLIATLSDTGSDALIEIFNIKTI